MRLRNFFWLFVSLGLIALIYFTTDASALLRLDVPYFLLSNILFFCSIAFWSFAWIYLMQEKLFPAFKINIKSLIGIFSPFGIGGDALRAYYAKDEHINPEKALASSFIAKFFKFLVMFVFLISAIYLLSISPGAAEVSRNILFFISALFITMLGAVLILMIRIERIAFVFYRLFRRRSFVLRLHVELNKQFEGLSVRRTTVAILLLLVSTFFEIMAVWSAFLAVNQPLLLAHIFIFSAVAHTLSLATITPQGTGFVEGGGYLVLSVGFFNLQKHVIGAFLIVWNLVRLWVPSLIGLFTTWYDSYKGK